MSGTISFTSLETILVEALPAGLNANSVEVQQVVNSLRSGSLSSIYQQALSLSASVSGKTAVLYQGLINGPYGPVSALDEAVALSANGTSNFYTAADTAIAKAMGDVHINAVRAAVGSLAGDAAALARVARIKTNACRAS